ncbi:MAG TPA: SRPBCC domain-containing protein [Kofleriaceae bacterium]|nr:SRPBCC domain-containing protein [Kofleriaceae bacterium]
MAFQVVKTFVVNAAPAAVWQFLIDPRRVAGCLPGAAITNQVDDKTYTGTMTIKVGPVTTSYKGKVVFQRLDADARVAEIVASGQDVKGKGGANMKLSSSLAEVGPGKTEITATSDVSVTGILAQMGRGMIQDVSDELFQIFSQRVRAELEAEAAASPPPSPPSGSDQATSVPATPVPVAPTPAAPVTVPPLSAPVVSAVPVSTPPVAALPVNAPEAALDLGAIGARAARRAALRMLSGPAFWGVLAVIAALVYILFIR